MNETDVNHYIYALLRSNGFFSNSETALRDSVVSYESRLAPDSSCTGDTNLYDQFLAVFLRFGVIQHSLVPYDYSGVSCSLSDSRRDCHELGRSHLAVLRATHVWPVQSSDKIL